MEVPEVEVVPGIYITDYRKKKRENSEQAVLTPQDYKRDIEEKGLDPEYLNAERKRYELAIFKLKETNDYLDKETDPELVKVVMENCRVIAKYQEIVKIIDEKLGESGSIYV